MAAILPLVRLTGGFESVNEAAQIGWSGLPWPHFWAN